jgi:hypothetical protein
MRKVSGLFIAKKSRKGRRPMPKKKLPQTTITEGKHHPQLQYAPVSFSHAV